MWSVGFDVEVRWDFSNSVVETEKYAFPQQNCESNTTTTVVTVSAAHCLLSDGLGVFGANEECGTSVAAAASGVIRRLLTPAQRM